MTTIITRAEKGSTLSFAEVDTNLNNLNNDKTEASTLASTATGEGASLVGIEDAGGFYTATTVESALQELATDSANAAYVAESTPNVLPSATGTDALAAGDGASALGVSSIAIGPSSYAQFNYGTSVGFTARTTSPDATAIGKLSSASNESAVAIGDQTSATGFGGLTAGWQSTASGTYSISFGKSSLASGAGAIAAGEQASATANHSIALSTQASVTAEDAGAIGYAASTTKTLSYAIGKYSIAERTNEVSFNITGVTGAKKRRGHVGYATSLTTVTPTEVFLGEIASERFTIATNSVVTFDLQVTAVDSVTGECASYQFRGAIKNIAGTTSLVGVAAKDILGEDNSAFDCAVTADDTNDALALTVTSAAVNNTIWSGQLFYTEAKV